MKSRTLLLTLLALLTLRLPAVAQQEEFAPDNLEAFDGQQWNGLTFGESTTRDIKKRFRTGKGAFRPEAMVLPQSRNKDVNIQVLMDSRGEDSKLVGFRLAYEKDGIELASLEHRLDAHADLSYPLERYSDWYLAAFAKKGIVAFVTHERDSETVSLLLLTSEKNVRRLLRNTEESKTTIRDFRDLTRPGSNPLVIGKTIVTLTGDELDYSRASLERRLQDRLPDLLGSREILYQRGESASCGVAVSVNYERDKGGTIRASATISGKTELGKISASGSANDKLPENQRDAERVVRRRIQDVMEDAVRDARSRADSQIQKQRPRNPQEYQFQVWNRLLNMATL